MKRWKVELEIIDNFPKPLSRKEILETVMMDTPDYIKVTLIKLTEDDAK